MPTYPTPLTPNDVQILFQTQTLAALGLSSTSYDKVRVAWQTQGQPAWDVTQDVTILRAVEDDDQYNRVRDVDTLENLTADGAIDGALIAVGGTGYDVDDTFLVTGGTAMGVVDDVGGSGAVTAFHFVSTGSGYTTGTKATTGGTGSGLTISVTLVGPNVDPTTVVQLTTYTRIWRLFWTIYGPTSFTNARLLRSYLFTQDMHDALAAKNLYFVTDPSAPQRVPEEYEKQWWERVDFSAQFNEAVTETQVINSVASVEVIVENSNGVVADIELTAGGYGVGPYGEDYGA